MIFAILVSNKFKLFTAVNVKGGERTIQPPASMGVSLHVLSPAQA